MLATFTNSSTELNPFVIIFPYRAYSSARNKAYSILKQEGFIQLDRRRGAVIAIDADKAKAYAEVKRALRIALAKGSLKNVSREEVHEMVDELFDEYGGKE